MNIVTIFLKGKVIEKYKTSKNMVSLEGGYDVDFVEEVPDEFLCCVCHLTLKEPVQIENCGHRLCKVCFRQMKERTERRYHW